MAWSVERAAQLCLLGEESKFEGKATLLNPNEVNGVRSAVEFLNGNGGAYFIEAFYVVMSNSQGAYFLLFKLGHKVEALRLFTMKDRTPVKYNIKTHYAPPRVLVPGQPAPPEFNEAELKLGEGDQAVLFENGDRFGVVHGLTISIHSGSISGQSPFHGFPAPGSVDVIYESKQSITLAPMMLPDPWNPSQDITTIIIHSVAQTQRDTVPDKLISLFKTSRMPTVGGGQPARAPDWIFKGDWTIVHMETNGEIVNDGTETKIGDTIHFEQETGSELMMVLDHVDIDGHRIGCRFKAAEKVLFEQKGEDMLIAWDISGGPKPLSFDTSDRPLWFMMRCTPLHAVRKSAPDWLLGTWEVKKAERNGTSHPASILPHTLLAFADNGICTWSTPLKSLHSPQQGTFHLASSSLGTDTEPCYRIHIDRPMYAVQVAAPVQVLPAMPAPVEIQPVVCTPVEVPPVVCAPLLPPADAFGQNEYPCYPVYASYSNHLNGLLKVCGKELFLTYGHSKGRDTPKDFDTAGRDQILLVFERSASSAGYQN